MQPFEWEQELFLFLNSHHTAASDSFFWWITTPINSWPLYVFLIGFMFWKFGWKQSIIFLVGLGIAIGLADVIASQIFKPLVNRPRPSHDPAIEGLVHTLHGYKGGPLGFVSSHASTSMAIALYFFLEWRKKVKWVGLLFVWTAVYSYSRIAVGVHFVGDILGGWLVGVIAVIIAIKILHFVQEKYNPWGLIKKE
ncbi:phosphatase PAP2 family protein [Flammeovirga kamogawensis]|uniref:Phosphatase PAP2 family protein n=1 Tax=Flammeovirga kamogawensis TaxID=373891 RepID=A0ABX8GTF0_9BACT|nr:phosphatase PAP2 family protein [Flammeovirga kamogawensis]MBB6460088.1 undecaprenyl-diphosphatase [Flammeovirga kamogawensis]QWG06868.1 phosphatase PAP2 family protein [Flammeovirga kamogawensis]TRX68690.1 phosphatase PAP2 family protein [Flammeovirga kamogawensis]